MIMQFQLPSLKSIFITSCILLPLVCISPAQSFSGSGFMVARNRDFVGEKRTMSDFDIIKDMIIHGGLSTTMKNRMRHILRKHYSKELNAYIEKRRQSLNKRNKRDAKRSSRMLNKKYKHEDGFSYHLMPDLKHVVMTAVFPVPVEELYSTLFGQEFSFYKNWMEYQQAYNIEKTDWRGDRDDDKVRVLDYKVTLEDESIYIPEGFINMRTEQVLYGSSKDGVRYVVDNHNYMDGIPFSELFHSVARHSFRSLSENKSELRVSVGLQFKGTPWPFLQDIIEDNVLPEYESDYKNLEERLSTKLGEST